MMDSMRAEAAVVGALLIDPSVLPGVREQVSPEDFHFERYRTIFRAACQMADAGERLDAVTIGRAAGVDNNTVIELAEATPTAAYALDYAGMVAQASQLRALGELGRELQEQALSSGADPADLSAGAARRIDEITTRSGGGVMAPADIVVDFLDHRERMDSGKVRVVRTGLRSVDGVIGGFLPGSLNVVGARPGVGKTAFGLAVADMIAKRSKVLFTSLEMGSNELTARRLSAVSGIPYNRLSFGNLDKRAYGQIAEASHTMASRKLFYDCKSRALPEIALSCQREKPELLVIDYLGLIQPEDPRATEYDRTTKASNDLKRLARRFDVPVLCLCQLNRESTASNDRRPTLSQLRSSGAIEQDADTVMLLHRPNYYEENKAGAGEAQPFEVNIAKNRHGATGTVILSWYAGCNRFLDTYRGRGQTWDVKSWL